MSVEEAGALLAGQYRALKAMQEEGMDLEDIHKSEVYLEFRARFLDFEDKLGELYSYGDLCVWQPGLMCGMTRWPRRCSYLTSARNEAAVWTVLLRAV